MLDAIALSEGHIEIVKTLLAAGAEVNFKGLGGSTPLVHAASKGHIEIVKTLLAAKADVNAENDSGDTALRYASINGYTEIVKILLAAGADINVVGTFGLTALKSALKNGHTEIVKLLRQNSGLAIATDRHKSQDFASLRQILLHSESLDEKIGAVYNLAKDRPQGAINEILETLKDPDGEMTLHASIALATFGEDALKLLRKAIKKWGTTGMHPSRRTPLNLRERLLYSLALLGTNGYVVLNEALQNEDETVQTSAKDLLSVIQRPLIFPDSIITVEKTCLPLGWNLPFHVKVASKSISLGSTSIHPKTLSVIAVLCAQQGLFGEGLGENI